MTCKQSIHEQQGPRSPSMHEYLALLILSEFFGLAPKSLASENIKIRTTTVTDTHMYAHTHTHGVYTLHSISRFYHIHGIHVHWR